MPDTGNKSAINYIFALGGSFSFYALYCFWMMEDDKSALWGFAYGLGLAAFIICVWGLLKYKKWALVLSYFLMLGALGFGAYIEHFIWTFWIFKEPTTLERILNVLHPKVSVFVAVPAFWLIFFTRPAQRNIFN